MQVISVIAVFTLATVVCANITQSSSGVVEATAIQTRSLRGEVHEGTFRRPKPVDTSENDYSSAKAPAGGDQNPPRRERKKPANGEKAPREENDGTSVEAPSGRDQTPPQRRHLDQPRTVTASFRGPNGGPEPRFDSSLKPLKLRRQTNADHLNRDNAGEPIDAPAAPRSNVPRRGDMISSIFARETFDNPL